MFNLLKNFLINNKSKREIWLFGSFNRTNFFHNTKALFVYVNKYHKKHIHAIWITENDALKKDLKSQGFTCYHCNSLLAFIYYKRAKYAITDWGISNILAEFAKISQAKQVNMWHGILAKFAKISQAKQVNMWHGIPLKKLEQDTEEVKKRIHTQQYQTNFLYNFGNPSFMFACSEYDKDKLSSGFNVSKDNIYITGFARNDYLFNHIPLLDKDIKVCNKIYNLKNNNQKLILFVPTFRDKKNIDLFAFIDDEFQSFLQNNNIIIVCKKHVADRFAQPKTTSQSVYWMDQTDDLYPVLNIFDILITDYSSIYFDFALTKKQIIHYCPDIEEYKQNIRGTYIDIKENLGGNLCVNIPQLKEAILNGKNYTDNIINKFHIIKNGNSCQKIINILRNEKKI